MQMGFLSAISSASVLIFALGAGVVVDRLKKRPVMIATDLCRAALLLLVPIAAMMHLLSMAILMTIAGIAGALTVLFDVAYQSYLPVLVDPDELLDSNRRLGMSASTAELLGPLLTGVLVKVVTAPIAILFGCLVFSCLRNFRMGHPEDSTGARNQPQRQTVGGGIRRPEVHLGTTDTSGITASFGDGFLAGGFFFTLYFLNATQVVHMGTPALGVAVALGGAGGLTGASLAGRLSTRLGQGQSSSQRLL